MRLWRLVSYISAATDVSLDRLEDIAAAGESRDKQREEQQGQTDRNQWGTLASSQNGVPGSRFFSDRG